MLKAALLSVIIPVYNVEPYLEQCLDSVVNQTYKNLEIICINDGSTDNSLKILEKYQKKDKRIKLINQKNQGASVARNAGLDIANGEYIAFVDSDDYLELNAYEEAMKVALCDLTVDMVEFNIAPFADDNHPNTKKTERYFKCVSNLKRSKYVYTPNIWNKVFKREIINNMKIRFIPKLYAQDQFFTAAYTICSKNYKFVNLPLYHYRVRCGSITGEQKSNGCERQIEVYYNFDALIQFAKKHGLYDRYKNFIYCNYLKHIYSCNSGNNEKIDSIIKHLDSKILVEDCPNDVKVKYLKKRQALLSKLKR